MDIQNLIIEEARRLANACRQVIETFCEKSLLDDQKRGVLVIEDFLRDVFEVRLDSRVPYGSVYICKEGTDLARFVPPPAEGG